jgi:hypothetical protein
MSEDPPTLNYKSPEPPTKKSVSTALWILFLLTPFLIIGLILLFGYLGVGL